MTKSKPSGSGVLNVMLNKMADEMVDCLVLVQMLPSLSLVKIAT